MPQTSTPKSRTIAQAEMRTINRSAVLEFLRQAKSTSRTEIARQLQISMPTAMRIIDQLITEGLVQYTGEKESGKGRSRELLAIDTANNLVIGIDLHSGGLTGCIASIGGELLQLFNKAAVWQSAEENFQTLVGFIKQIIVQPLAPYQRILGITIAVPGIVEYYNGNISVAPSLDWYNFPLLSRLEPLFTLPILIENDVNLAMLGEHWFGAAAGVEDALLLSIGRGIGAGILLDGKLHRGFRGASGEVGYLLSCTSELNQQYPGYGALEMTTSERGILQRAKDKCEQYGLPFNVNWDSQDIFQAARQGKGWALEVVDAIVDTLSLVIANLSVCFDPALILLGGKIAQSSDLLLEPIRQRLQGVIPHVPTLEIVRLKDQAALYGCVVLTFQKVTEYSIVLTA
jgi:glucokinase